MTNQNYIWNYLRNAGITAEAAAGVMGNLQAESSCESVRVEGDFSTDRTASKNYVVRVDSGEHSANLFASDGKGFGLAQWTYPARKRNLLSYCQGRGKSVGSLDAQLGFLVLELQSEYGALWNALKSCRDILTATRRVLEEYERPAVLNTDTRYGLAQEIYLRLDGTENGENEAEKENDRNESELEKSENKELENDGINNEAQNLKTTDEAERTGIKNQIISLLSKL